MKDMDITYVDADEKYVASVIVYSKNESDGYVYADPECTINIDRLTLINLLHKDLIIVKYNNAYYSPISYKDTDGVVTLTIATAISTSASESLELKSKENN